MPSRRKKKEEAPVPPEQMIAMLQQRLAALQEMERREGETEAHRLELEDKVLNPQSAEEAVDTRYSELAEELAALNFKKRMAGDLNETLLRSAAHMGPQCKALPAQFQYKESAAFDKTRAAVVHHFGGGGGGSHYHLAASKQFQKGLRLKGVVSRHSQQAAIRNGPTGSSGPPTGGKLSKKARLRRKQSLARDDI